MSVFIEKSPITSSSCYKTIKTASILNKTWHKCWLNILSFYVNICIFCMYICYALQLLEEMNEYMLTKLSKYCPAIRLR
jgi:hypothetical protein